MKFGSHTTVPEITPLSAWMPCPRQIKVKNNFPNVDIYNYDTYVAVSGCPSNFFYIDSSNLCYQLFEMNLQWRAASMYCRALDSRAHLVVINTEEEQQEIARGLSGNPSK